MTVKTRLMVQFSYSFCGGLVLHQPAGPGSAHLCHLFCPQGKNRNQVWDWFWMQGTWATILAEQRFLYCLSTSYVEWGK